MRQTAFLSHPSCLLHDMGQGHPECPARLQAISDQLTAQRLAESLQRIEAPLATMEQLERVHDRAYIDSIMQQAPKSGIVQLDPDTLMNPHSLQAALRAAGACVSAVDQVLAGTASNAFCAVRPPGHHAEHDRAMGFCLFNNIAVGAAHALAEGGLKRVAILDFDVHHGNGTEDMFHDNDQVLFCSTYQHPFYPYSEPDRAASNIIHCPLPAGSGSDVFRQAVSESWLPALDRFEPQMLLMSAGFDAHQLDPLASLRLIEDDYQWVTQTLLGWANEHCQGHVVSTLEGGYHLDALGRSTAAHIKCLMDL